MPTNYWKLYPAERMGSRTSITAYRFEPLVTLPLTFFLLPSLHDTDRLGMGLLQLQ